MAADLGITSEEIASLSCELGRRWYVRRLKQNENYDRPKSFDDLFLMAQFEAHRWLNERKEEKNRIQKEN